MAGGLLGTQERVDGVVLVLTVPTTRGPLAPEASITCACMRVIINSVAVALLAFQSIRPRLISTASNGNHDWMQHLQPSLDALVAMLTRGQLSQ